MIDSDDIDLVLSGIMEQLASIEHVRWSHWQRHMHSQGIMQTDGSLILPAKLVERWDRQAITDYDDLSANEKESDREQVNRYLPIIAAAFKNR